MKQSLPIRQRISALTCLKPGPKAVLTEVCELHENGGRGCFASNDALSKKLGVSLATVTRTVASLHAWGLLTPRVVPAEANRRYLVPTAAVRACYVGGSEVQQLDAVANLTIVKSRAEQDLTIVKSEGDYSQNDEVTIVKNEVDYSQNASRVIGDEQDEQKTNKDEQALREALALAEKKIAMLESQLAESENGLQLSRKTITDLRAELQASHTKGRAANVATSVAHLPYSGEAFLAKWADLRQVLGVASNGPRERELLATLATLATTEKQAIEVVANAIRKNWKDLYPLDKPLSHDHPSQHRPATFQRPAQAARSGDARQPIAEGIQHGPILTGKLSDL